MSRRFLPRSGSSRSKGSTATSSSSGSGKKKEQKEKKEKKEPSRAPKVEDKSKDADLVDDEFAASMDRKLAALDESLETFLTGEGATAVATPATSGGVVRRSLVGSFDEGSQQQQPTGTVELEESIQLGDVSVPSDIRGESQGDLSAMETEVPLADEILSSSITAAPKIEDFSASDLPALGESTRTEDEERERDALEYLLRYEQMVRQQDAEEMATVTHLRPLYDRLRYLGRSESTSGPQKDQKTVDQLFASVAEVVGPPGAAQGGDVAAPGDNSTIQSVNSLAQQSRDQFCDTGDLLSFEAIKKAYNILDAGRERSAAPPTSGGENYDEEEEEVMSTDEQLMMLLRILVDAYDEVLLRTGTDRLPSPFAPPEDRERDIRRYALSFPEFVHGYKTVIAGMQTLQMLPSVPGDDDYDDDDDEDDDIAGVSTIDDDENDVGASTRKVEDSTRKEQTDPTARAARTYHRSRTRERTFTMARGFGPDGTPDTVYDRPLLGHDPEEDEDDYHSTHPHLDTEEKTASSTAKRHSFVANSVDHPKPEPLPTAGKSPLLEPSTDPDSIAHTDSDTKPSARPTETSETVGASADLITDPEDLRQIIKIKDRQLVRLMEEHTDELMEISETVDTLRKSHKKRWRVLFAILACIVACGVVVAARNIDTLDRMYTSARLQWKAAKQPVISPEDDGFEEEGKEQEEEKGEGELNKSASKVVDRKWSGEGSSLATAMAEKRRISQLEKLLNQCEGKVSDRKRKEQVLSERIVELEQLQDATSQLLKKAERERSKMESTVSVLEGRLERSADQLTDVKAHFTLCGENVKLAKQELEELRRTYQDAVDDLRQCQSKMEEVNLALQVDRGRCQSEVGQMKTAVENAHGPCRREFQTLKSSISAVEGRCHQRLNDLEGTMLAISGTDDAPKPSETVSVVSRGIDVLPTDDIPETFPDDSTAYITKRRRGSFQKKLLITVGGAATIFLAPHVWSAVAPLLTATTTTTATTKAAAGRMVAAGGSMGGQITSSGRSGFLGWLFGRRSWLGKLYGFGMSSLPWVSRVKVK